jgi:hypothetical protein
VFDDIWFTPCNWKEIKKLNWELEVCVFIPLFLLPIVERFVDLTYKQF